MKVLTNKTKKAATIAVTLIIVFTTNTFSYPINFKKNYKEMRTQIIEQISFPRTLTKNVEKEKAEVLFSVMEDGKLLVHKVKTENKELENYVKQNFEKINVELEKIETNDVYKMDVEYNLINQ